MPRCQRTPRQKLDVARVQYTDCPIIYTYLAQRDSPSVTRHRRTSAATLLVIGVCFGSPLLFAAARSQRTCEAGPQLLIVSLYKRAHSGEAPALEW